MGGYLLLAALFLMIYYAFFLSNQRKKILKQVNTYLKKNDDVVDFLVNKKSYDDIPKLKNFILYTYQQNDDRLNAIFPSDKPIFINSTLYYEKKEFRDFVEGASFERREKCLFSDKDYFHIYVSLVSQENSFFVFVKKKFSLDDTLSERYKRR